MQFPSSSIYLVASRQHSLGRSHKEIVGTALNAGIKLVQYREKSLSLPFSERLREILALKKLTMQHGALLIVNDDPRLALLGGADGVHLGQEDMSTADARKLESSFGRGGSSAKMKTNMLQQVAAQLPGELLHSPTMALIAEDAAAKGRLIIGESTHNEEEVAAALHKDIQYLNIGPIFATNTKQNKYPPLGLDGLRRCIKIYNSVCAAIGKKIPFTVMGGIKQEHIQPLASMGCRYMAIITGITASRNVRSDCELLTKNLQLAVEEFTKNNEPQK